MTALVTKHLPLVAGAQNGIHRLRELILDLAVQGRLLTQHADDEPAETLYAQLVNDREQKVRSKLIRAAKGIPPALRDDLGFCIPGNWVPVRLGEVGDWGAGATPARSNPSYYGPGTPWFKSGELSSDFIDVAEESVTDLALKECSLRLNQPGDVLIAMYGATIGKTSILAVTATTNQAVCACTPFKGVYNRFLLMMLKAIKRQFVGQGAGGAQPNISKEKIVATAIGLPPLAEQHRIVAKVDELMALCDRLEADQADAEAAHAQLVQALLGSLTQATDAADFTASWQRLSEHFHALFTTEASIDALKQTVLQLAVTGRLVRQDASDGSAQGILDEVRAIQAASNAKRRTKTAISSKASDTSLALPAQWVSCELQDAFDVRDGTHDTPSYQSHGVPLVTSKNLSSGRLDMSNVKLISMADHLQISERSKVDVGDVLFAMIGSIGNPVLVETDQPFSIKNVALFKHYDATLTVPRYLLLYLLVASDEMRAQSAGGVQSFISLGSLRSFPVPLPPTKEQHRIVSKVDELMALCDQLKTQLKQARQHHAQLASVMAEQAVA